MAKTKLKTHKNDGDVENFIKSIENKQRKKDTEIVVQMMKEASGERPLMCGENIIGFGTYDYKYDSGRQGEWMRIAVSPGKQTLTLYIMDGFSGYHELLNRLGKHKTGKACLYIKKLEDVDTGVLRELIEKSYNSKNALGEAPMSEA
jgi:hypothetical protein